MDDDCDFSLNLYNEDPKPVAPAVIRNPVKTGIKRPLDLSAPKMASAGNANMLKGRARLLQQQSSSSSDPYSARQDNGDSANVDSLPVRYTEHDSKSLADSAAITMEKPLKKTKPVIRARNEDTSSKNCGIEEIDSVKGNHSLENDGDTTASNVSKKSKHKTLTAAEDPNQYHAKPRDLDNSETLLRPSTTIKASEYIFTDENFSKFDINDELKQILEKSKAENGFGIKKATRIQLMSLPVLLERKNVLLRSETGSGKTLAYLLPIVNDLINMSPKVSRSDGTLAIIIAPTRELCIQINNVLTTLLRYCVYIVNGCIYGGEKRKSEKARIRKGITILVTTPGRLLDHLKLTESLNLNKLRWIVLDEADRLLDMGFEKTILDILNIIRGNNHLVSSKSNDSSKSIENNKSDSNQNIGLHRNYKSHLSSLAKKSFHRSEIVHIMASATITNSLRKLAKPIMDNKSYILVDADIQNNIKNANKTNNVDNSMKVIEFNDDDDQNAISPSNGGFDANELVETPQQLSQYFMHVTCKWRLAALLSFLKQHLNQKVMVFFSTCDSVDYHALLLKHTMWPDDLDNMNPNDKDYAATINHNNDSIESIGSHFNNGTFNNSNIYRMHGNIPQKLRLEVFNLFSNTKNGILLCTDVAARGLDLPHVDWILQYDPPCDTTDYVHRIGRTARKGLQGNALLFLLPSEAPYISLLATHGLHPMALSLQTLFMDTIQYVSNIHKFKNSDEMCAVAIQRRVELTVLKNKYLTLAARQAYRSFIRAYATHSSDTKGIFKVQLLHLGHVAKSFGLVENVNNIRHHEDVISKIMNGMFSTSALQSVDKKALRNMKYSLSEKGKKGNLSTLPTKGIKRNRENDTHDSSENKKIRSDNAGIGDSDASVKYGEGTSKHSVKNRLAKVKASNQKVRKLGSSVQERNGDSSAPAPSGRFRKTSGYFRKQLRSQSTFEFNG
jgi:ATP-dependent RNA helicase DDX31/DBP7